MGSFGVPFWGVLGANMANDLAQSEWMSQSSRRMSVAKQADEFVIRRRFIRGQMRLFPALFAV
jgi:hypothetical protein